MKKKQQAIQEYLTLSNDFLETAEILFSAGHYLRAISDAYYAMFHATKAVLQSIDIITKTHNRTIVQLNYHFVRTKKLDKWYTFILEQMKKSCETSDYKPFKDNEFVEDFDAFFYSFKDQAEGAIDTAKQFVAKMREFL